MNSGYKSLSVASQLVKSFSPPYRLLNHPWPLLQKEGSLRGVRFRGSGRTWGRGSEITISCRSILVPPSLRSLALSFPRLLVYRKKNRLKTCLNRGSDERVL